MRERIIWWLFRRISFTQAEYEYVIKLVIKALDTLETEGEDGIVKARAILYNIHRTLW